MKWTGLSFMIVLYTLFGMVGCRSEKGPAGLATVAGLSVLQSVDQTPAQMALDRKYGKGALLLSRFDSYEELMDVVQIKYDYEIGNPLSPLPWRPVIRIFHTTDGRQVTAVLKAGVTENDFAKARDGDTHSRIYLLLKSPYSILRRDDLKRVYILARWRSDLFQEGDVAFYDLAETMMEHISPVDKSNATVRDLSEKGYINTFNHITNQAIITSVISERLADFIADAHERYHIPKLITGNFTDEEIADIENGPVDNLVDMINNEWGQELGKQLKQKYGITRMTKWSPRLLAKYLNDIQLYFSKAFGIGFAPFYPNDEIVIRFSDKLNMVMHQLDLLGK